MFDIQTPRGETEGFGSSMENYFRGYSEKRFLQEFPGSQKNKWGDYENLDGSFSRSYITAQEDVIRAKLLEG